MVLIKKWRFSALKYPLFESSSGTKYVSMDIQERPVSICFRTELLKILAGNNPG
jgi:hypothetical protein